MPQKKSRPFVIKGTVPTDDIPKWARRSPKWEDLKEAVFQLVPGGDSLEVEFDDDGEARRAANTIRDMINLREKSAVIRTRLVKQEDEETGEVNGAVVFFTRLTTDQVVEAEE